eukprot:COSAG05_NODE_1769_length_4114_cov_2.830137_6_plen_147_part_00
MAAQVGESAGKMTANLGETTANIRKTAEEKAAGARAAVQDGMQHAHVRAHGMEGRARMEAAAAKSHAEMRAHKTGSAINKRIKGDGPPTAPEVVEEMDKLSKEIVRGSVKGKRIALLRKWSAELEQGLVFEENLVDLEAEAVAAAA